MINNIASYTVYFATTKTSTVDAKCLASGGNIKARCEFSGVHYTRHSFHEPKVQRKLAKQKTHPPNNHTRNVLITRSYKHQFKKASFTAIERNTIVYGVERSGFARAKS